MLKDNSNEQLLVVYENNKGDPVIYTTVYNKEQADNALLQCVARHSTPGNKVKTRIIPAKEF